MHTAKRCFGNVSTHLALGLLGALLSGCAMLAPRIPDKPAVADLASPTLVSSEQQRLLDELEHEGRQRLIDTHFRAMQAREKEASGGNDVRLLIDGPATFAAMFAELEKARRQILIESYIFENSEIGLRIADILLRKKAEGVEVNVIYDSVGSFDTPSTFFQTMRDSGIAVCEFNPVTGLRRKIGLINLNHRDHRKLLVVDGEVAFTGGINISSVYSFGSARTRKKIRLAQNDGWRDTHVRISGPAVTELAAGFHATWRRQQCSAEASVLEAAAPARVEGRVVVVLNGRGGNESASRFYRVLLDAINNASLSISLTMGYFVPDPAIVDALKAAAARGVRTQLVLPGKSDSLLVLRAGQNRYAELMNAGVLIYEQQEGFLHAKTAVIDGVWSTVGSSNLDWRSFLHNDEVNVVILGRDFGAAMDRLFDKDRNDAVKITPETWNSRGLNRRFMEGVGQFWEYWL